MLLRVKLDHNEMSFQNDVKQTQAEGCKIICTQTLKFSRARDRGRV